MTKTAVGWGGVGRAERSGEIKWANNCWCQDNGPEKKSSRGNAKVIFARAACRFRCQSRPRVHRLSLIGKLPRQTEVEELSLLKRYRVENWQRTSYYALGAGGGGGGRGADRESRVRKGDKELAAEVSKQYYDVSFSVQ